MQNRQRDELVRDVLSICNGGAPITKIMFHAYMAHGQAKLYLTQIMEQGLVEFDRLERKYYATAKGMDYLATFEKLIELVPIVTNRSAPSERLASIF